MKTPAFWIANRGEAMISWEAPTLPAPLFRKTFELKESPQRAALRICGLGFFELYLNGKRVGDQVLAPSLTIYDRRYRYRTFDVAALLQPGTNVIGVILGNGLYNCQTPDCWHFDKATWRDYPKLCCQLEWDGGTLGTDSSWLTADGPILFDSLRGGETYDARQEKEWLGRDIDAAEWRPAAIVAGPGGIGEEDFQPPCRVVETLPMSACAPGLYVAPRNLAGWARLSVRGSSGSRVIMRFGERLTADGMHLDNRYIAAYVYDDTFQRDEYILKGEGLEVWEPRFTYHGFSHVEVEIIGAATIEKMEARVVHNDFAIHGHLTASDPTVEILQAAAENSILDNSVDLPTDCPHREKNGWSSEIQLQMDPAFFFSDCYDFYAAYIDTLGDSQRPSGQLSGMSPVSGWGYNWGCGPAWDSAFLHIPLEIYRFTGDAGVMRRNHDRMKKYLEYCATVAENQIIRKGLGDWRPPDGIEAAAPELICTAFYYRMITEWLQINRILGREEASAGYAELGEAIRRAFNAAFYHGEGLYGNGNSTAPALALVFGLADRGERDKIRQRLLDRLEERQYRVDYGTIGSRAVPRALLENDEVDTAWNLMRQPEYPGYLYWHHQFNATTFFESWTGEGDLTSRNHGAFTNIIGCMYEFFGGFRHELSRPGIGHLTIRPLAPAALRKFRAEYRGFVSEWERRNGKIVYRLTVPSGSKATWILPGCPPREITGKAEIELP